MNTSPIKTRCFANNENQQLYAQYHDLEWGRPVHDDRVLFEMLCLEGAQAGLSWEIVLKRREAYRQAFHYFDPIKVSLMTDLELNDLLKNEKIIRNKLKVFAFRKNAQAFLEIQKEFGSFNQYLWAYVNFTPIKNHWDSFAKVPCFSTISESISKDLKKRKMTFVGPKIIYAFMQAVGLVNDHLKCCFLYNTDLS